MAMAKLRPPPPRRPSLQLDVRLPMPSANGGREEATLAVLGRGHTVGEAVLLVGGRRYR